MFTGGKQNLFTTETNNWNQMMLYYQPIDISPARIKPVEKIISAIFMALKVLNMNRD